MDRNWTEQEHFSTQGKIYLSLESPKKTPRTETNYIGSPDEQEVLDDQLFNVLPLVSYAYQLI